MARKSIRAHGITPSNADKTLHKIRAWRQEDDPTCDEIHEWLARTVSEFKKTAVFIYSNAEIIGQQRSENERLEALAVWQEAVDFVERAEVASEILDGVPAGRVSNAFLEGLRLGLMYERMLSFIDGRYRERWVQQEVRQRAAKTTNEAHAELHGQYQPEVNELMADGLSYTAASNQVGSNYGVSGRTVRDHTTNPAPRNRGRHR